MTRIELEALEAVVRIAHSLEKIVNMLEEERNGDDTREESEEASS